VPSFYLERYIHHCRNQEVEIRRKLVPKKKRIGRLLQKVKSPLRKTRIITCHVLNKAYQAISLLGKSNLVRWSL
jgi:hypothetical protein